MSSYQDLSEFRVPPGFRGRSALVIQLWWLVQATLFACSPQFAVGWRRFLLRLFGAEVGQGVRIRPSARITYPWKVKIGDRTWIGDRAELYSLYPLTIGANVCISQDVYLCTGSHDPDARDFRYVCAPITVYDEVWIAAGAFVSPGVTIGYAAVVGARSLVLSDLEGEKVYAGSPAHLLRRRRGGEHISPN
jgi:putative colanic acid biosynthesis acetyltransferase WcaF